MRLVSYGSPRAERPGLLVHDEIVPLMPVLRSIGVREGDMNTVIGLLPYARSLFEAAADTEEGIPVANVRLGPPVPQPTNIVGLGLTYRGKVMPQGELSMPVFFSKPTTTLIGPNDSIIYPAETTMLAYEAELVIVIGREGRNLNRDQASALVAGYTAGNDLTMPDVIFGDAMDDPASLHPLRAQLFRGKAHDTCLPVGPCVVTVDEVSNVDELELGVEVNGASRQQAHVGDMMFDVPGIISMVSRFMTLSPGDLVLTGSPSMGPSGLGLRDPARYVQPGDMVSVSLSGIGMLRNRVCTID